MSAHALRRGIAQIKRAANIDFEKQAYEEAAERHWLRFRLMRLAWLQDDQNGADGCGMYDGDEMVSKTMIVQRLSKFKRALGSDTPEQWRKDQATIEAYHMDKYGNLDRAMRHEAFGADMESMWIHYVGLTNEAVREAKEQPAELTIGADYVERPREKPVRLHPSILGPVHGEFDPLFANLFNCYTPEFADGQMRPDLSQFYPYDDYQEFDGKTVIEFYNKKS